MPNDPTIPSELINAGAAGNLIVFAGAGVSCDARGPSWLTLIQGLRDRAIAHERNQSRPNQSVIDDLGNARLNHEDAAQAISDRMGQDWLIREVRDLSVQEKNAPGPLAVSIARLGPACIITTNYDTVLERAFRAISPKVPPVLVGTSPRPLTRDLTGYIWKIHGDLKTSEAFVLSRGDFLRMKESQAWSRRLEAFFQPPYAVLFVGYGANDPDITDAMHALRLAFANELSLGFWIEPHTPQVQRRARELNLQLLPIANHASIPGWIDGLRARIDVEKRRKAPVVVAMPSESSAELARQYKDKLAQARGLLELADFKRAVELVRTELASVQALLQRTPGDTRLEKVAVELLLFLGHSLAISQELDAGIATLREALAQATDLDQRARAVERLAALGDIDVAKPALWRRRSAKYSRARQLVQLAEGTMPADLPDDSMLQLRAAFLDLEQGEIQASVDRVIHHPWDPKEPLLALSRANLLHNALTRALPLPPVRSLSRETRQEIVELLATYYRQDSSGIPEPIRDDYESQRHAWLWLVEDPARPAAPPAIDDSAITREQRIQNDVFQSFQAAVEQRNFTEATERLAHLVDPVLVWLCRVRLASARGDGQSALDVVLNAVAEMPDVAPLEAAAAEQLQRAAMLAPATLHSRRAFELLPGIGNRLRLIECLLEDPASESTEELRALTSALADDDRIEVLPYRLEVAQRNHDTATALMIADRIESIAPPAAPVRIQVAEARVDLGDPRGAAKRAWAAFGDGGEKQWTPRMLAKAAQIQRLGLTENRDSSKLDHRLAAIRKALDDRFESDDVEAEQARIVVSRLGGPEWRIAGDPGPLEAAGILRRIHRDELEQDQRAHVQAWVASRNAYDRGDLSAEGLCLPFAVSVFSLVAGTSTSALPLMTPISLRVESRRIPPTSRWLLGDLELAALAELDLLDNLSEYLRRSGTKVVIFQDVHARILRDARTLEVLAPRDSLRSSTRFETSIDGVAIAGLGSGPEEQRMRASWAEDARRRIAAADAAAQVRLFLSECDQRNWLERIERPGVELPPSLPGRDEWRTELARVLSWHEAIQDNPELSLVTADYVVGSIFATAAPMASRSVLWAVDMHLYRDLSTRVRGNEPRLLNIPDIAATICDDRPTQLRDRMLRMGFHSAVDADDIREMAQRHTSLNRGDPDNTLRLLESRAARADDPSAYLAEFHVASLYARAAYDHIKGSASTGMTALGVFRQLAGRLEQLNPREGEALATFLRLLITGLLQDPLLWLRKEAENRYELDDESPGARFWRAAQSWLDEDPSPRPVSRRRGTWARACGSTVNQWIDDLALDNARAAPLVMAMNAEKLDARVALVTPMGWSLSIADAAVSGEFLALVKYGAEGSSRQGEYMLRDIIDAAVQRITAYAEQVRDGRAASPAWSLTPEPRFVFRTDVILGTPLEFHVPLAAVLLRSRPEVIATLGEWLSEALAGYNGRLRAALKELTKEPENQERRRDFARAAASSPVHEIYMDPLSIRGWGFRLQATHGYPGSLDDLCEVLGEPPVALPKDVIGELDSRFREGGPWNESDTVALSTVRSIAYVPGLIGAWAATQRSRYPDPTDLVAGAWNRLAEPDDHPAGRIASDIMFLRLAIARQRRWEIGGGSVDVVAGLGDRIARAMKSALAALSEPRPGLLDASAAEPGVPNHASDTISFANTEPAVLRMIWQVVGRLSASRVTTLRDLAWMTHRLHQWYSDRLLELPRETRRQALAALQEFDRPRHLDSSDVLLPQQEPDHSPDWVRYRLRVILYSVATMEIFCQVEPHRASDVVRETAETSEPRSVSSPSLEKALLDAVAIPSTTRENEIRERVRIQPDSDASELPWGIDAAIPDLALLALVSVDPSRFVTFPIEIRLGWFRWMYTDISTQLSGALAVAAADNIAALSSGERDQLAEKLSDLPHEDGDLGIAPALLACALLGRSNIGVEGAQPRTLAALPPQATGLSRRLLKAYLLGAARANPNEFLEHARELFRTLEERQLDPVGHSLALGPLLSDAPVELVRVVSKLMWEFAGQPPYSQSDEVRHMVKTYGVDGDSDA